MLQIGVGGELSCRFRFQWVAVGDDGDLPWFLVKLSFCFEVVRIEEMGIYLASCVCLQVRAYEGEFFQWSG